MNQVESVESVDGSSRSSIKVEWRAGAVLLFMPCSWSTMPQAKCKKIYHFARTCQISGRQKKPTNTLNDCDSDAVTMFIGAIEANRFGGPRAG